MWLDQIIAWEEFREPLQQCRNKSRKSKAGRQPSDVVMMFKALVLQHHYNLRDDELEFQIRDRYSFADSSNLVLKIECLMPKPLWLFREQLTQQGLVKALFNDVGLQWREKGFKAQKGHIIDASFISAPIQRNGR